MKSFARATLITAGAVLLGLPGARSETFHWTAACGIDWYDCCELDETENQNNWDVEPVPKPDCPVYPGEPDHVELGDTSLVHLSPLAPAPITIASLSSDGCNFRLDKGLTVTGNVNLLGDFTHGTSLFTPGPTMTVDGVWSWRGGELAGPGTATCIGEIRFETLGNAIISERTVVNAGNAFWMDTGNILLGFGGTLENQFFFEIQNDEWVADQAGGGTFRNIGTTTKRLSDGETVFFPDVTVENPGTFIVETGTVHLQGPGLCTGTYRVDGGATLRFNTAGDSEYVFDDEGDIDGDGIVLVTGGGPVVFTDTTTVDIENLTMSGGEIENHGIFEVNGLTWDQFGGDLTGPGTTTVLVSQEMSGFISRAISEQTFYMGPATSWTDGDINLRGGTEIINGVGAGALGGGTGGTFTAQDDADRLAVTSSEAGTVTNPLGGTIFIASDDMTFDGGGSVATAVLNNDGTIKASGTSWWLTNGFVVNNTGLFHVQSGEVRLTNLTNYVQTAGTTRVDEGATFRTTNLSSFTGGTIEGNGTIWLAGGLTNGGMSVMPGASPGVLTINSDYTQGEGGTLSIELGGLTQGTEYDLLAVTGSAALGGVVEVALIDGFVPSEGDSFEVVTASTVSGAFTTVDLVDFPEGLGVDVIYNAASVVLTIAGTSAAPDVVEPEALARPLVVYPNPTRSDLTVAFRAPSGSPVLELAMFDVTGRKVRTLIDGAISEGVKRVRWNGRDEQGATVAAGVYFARLTAEGRTLDRQRVLVIR